jgi:predicted enzyme related to lactoylglutathione lyase
VREDASWGEGMRWVRVAPKDAQTPLTLVTWLENMPPGSLHVVLIETDDVDRTYAELSEQGADFIQTPFDGTGGRFASFRDPDGNSWLLHAN